VSYRRDSSSRTIVLLFDDGLSPETLKRRDNDGIAVLHGKGLWAALHCGIDDRFRRSAAGG
jgi:hypothetical protein